jgi:hypothetical protein
LYYRFSNTIITKKTNIFIERYQGILQMFESRYCENWIPISAAASAIQISERPGLSVKNNYQSFYVLNELL